MTAALRHRGPDGEGVDRLGPATIVHTRLAIIDVPGGAQPLHSEDRPCSVVVNGEIYNHKELRADLEARGHTFAHALRLGGRGPRVRGVRRRLRPGSTACSPSSSGTAASGGCSPPATRSASSPSIGGPTAAAWRSLRRSARCSPPDWSSRAVDRTRARPLPGLPLRAGATHPVRRDLEAARRQRSWWRPRTAQRGVSSYREAPGDAVRRRERRELAAELADALHRRRRAADDVRRPVRRVSVAAGSTRRRSWPRWRAGRSTRRRPSRSGSRATATCSTSAPRSARPPRRSAPTTTTPRWSRATSSASSRSLRAPSRGAVRHPSAPALMQLSRFAARNVKVVLSGQGADEPHGGYGRHQAAAALGAARAPRAARGAAARRGGLARGNERARRAARLARRDDATASGWCGWSSHDDAVRGRPGRRSRRRRGGGAGRAGGRACSATSTAGRCRTGALPRHPAVPSRPPARLRRQDVDVGPPRTARPVPRRRADAVRRADPGPRPRAAPAGKRLHRRAMAQMVPPEASTGPSTGSRRPTTPGCAVARRGGREPLARRRARRPDRPRRRRRLVATTAPAAPTTSASSTACSSSRSGTAPSSREARSEPTGLTR